MRERPIIFSAPMVRAILAGQKTQTRRVVKLQPKAPVVWENSDGMWRWGQQSQFPSVDDYEIGMKCPFGSPGDRLWVKETWRTGASLDNDSPGRIADKSLDANYRKPWAPLKYDADGDTSNGDTVADFGGWSIRTRSPIHMPRWASRITLEITGVKVERLNEISEEDAVAEGCTTLTYRDGRGVESAKLHFRTLWQSINGPGSWEVNPWVWAITFRKAGG